MRKAASRKVAGASPRSLRRPDRALVARLVHGRHAVFPRQDAGVEVDGILEILRDPFPRAVLPAVDAIGGEVAGQARVPHEASSARLREDEDAVRSVRRKHVRRRHRHLVGRRTENERQFRDGRRAHRVDVLPVGHDRRVDVRRRADHDAQRTVLVLLIPGVPPVDRVARDHRGTDAVEHGEGGAPVEAHARLLDGRDDSERPVRRDAGDEEYEDRPLGVVIGATTYVDATVVPDRKYVYTVRAAPVAELPLVLGPASDEVPVSTADVFPPDAPDGVLILAEAGGTRLVWNPSLAGDLASYRVYRREDGAWKRIAQDLKDPVYFDAGVLARE